MASTRIRTGWSTLVQALIDARGRGARARTLLEGIAREPWVQACGLWRLEESHGSWECLLSRGPVEMLHARSFLEEVAAGRTPADLAPGRGVLITGRGTGALALTYAGRPESETEFDLLTGLLHVVRLVDAADGSPASALAESYVAALPGSPELRQSGARPRSVCEPAECLERIVERESGPCARARILLELELDPGVRGCLVHASTEEFERAILNLLRNAVEAQEQAAEGGRIRIALQPAARDELVLTVEDAGPGLPEGVVAALEGSGPEALPEPGLGLAISWGIVLSAGGGLRALHDGEHGACLEIRLPVAHRA